MSGGILNNLDNLIKDFRDSTRTIYRVQDLMMTTILSFLSKAGARKNIKKRFEEKNIINAVNRFNGSNLAQLPHGDTLEYFYKSADVADLREVLHLMNKQAIRSKKFDPKYLLQDEYYMVCIDMTRTQKFLRKANDGLLWEDKNGIRYYYNAVVEAKFVFRNKLCIPVLSEFVENDDTVDGKFVKQNCELKAAYRLIENLKKMFPRLKICLLFDGLYPCENIFRLCKEYNLKYIMSFDEGKIPSLYKQFQNFVKINYYNEKRKTAGGMKDQRVKYQTNLNYCGYDINFIEFNEYSLKDGKKYHNIFLTNLDVTDDCVFKITEGGRLRWKIEHTFDKQKNLFFNLKHAYSHKRNSIKAYHIILQISDWILTFMLYLYNFNGESLVFKHFESLSEFCKHIFTSLAKEALAVEDYHSIKYAIFVIPKIT